MQHSDGRLAPGLAQSWSYAGTGNTKFVMHLRPGVKFSDGGPLDAQASWSTIALRVHSAGQMSPFLAVTPSPPPGR